VNVAQKQGTTWFSKFYCAFTDSCWLFRLFSTALYSWQYYEVVDQVQKEASNQKYKTIYWRCRQIAFFLVLTGFVISIILNDYFLTEYLWLAFHSIKQPAEIIRFYHKYNLNVYFLLGFALVISFGSAILLCGTIFRLK
jgi:hypothetical protein